MKRTLSLIEIDWVGPYSLEGVGAFDGLPDRGLIAVYGTHPVFGDGALLYILDAAQDTFAVRIAQIGDWLSCLPSDPVAYLGRLGGTEPVDDAEWRALIDVAHRLEVFFHAPPWNARGVDAHGIEEPTVVLNLGRRHRLAMEVSTLWNQSAWDPKASSWRPYGSVVEEDNCD